MTCGILGMAKKAKFSRHSQEMRGGTEVAHRQPHFPVATILIQLPAAALARKVSVPKRRLAIAVEREADADTPRPVKIVRLG
jgi:hypothetical protein